MPQIDGSGSTPQSARVATTASVQQNRANGRSEPALHVDGDGFTRNPLLVRLEGANPHAPVPPSPSGGSPTSQRTTAATPASQTTTVGEAKPAAVDLDRARKVLTRRRLLVDAAVATTLGAGAALVVASFVIGGPIGILPLVGLALFGGLLVSKVPSLRRWAMNGSRGEMADAFSRGLAEQSVSAADRELLRQLGGPRGPQRP